MIDNVQGWTPRTDAEREQWKSMCRKYHHAFMRQFSVTHDEAFDTIVAPVPRVLRSVKGVTYQDGLFHRQGYNFQRASSVIDRFRAELTDDDHAALMALKADPYEPAPAAPALTRQQCVDALVGMGAESYNAGELAYSVQLPPLSTVLILKHEVTP